MLNSNIRCIEIGNVIGIGCNTVKLNSNIRCIEIYMQATNDLKKKQLNSNIRCIEMLDPFGGSKAVLR